MFEAAIVSRSGKNIEYITFACSSAAAVFVPPPENREPIVASSTFNSLHLSLSAFGSDM